MKRPTGKRILMLLENNPFCYDTRTKAEASTLTAAGYHVTVIAPAAPGRRWHEVLDGVTTYSYRPPAAFDGVLGFIWEYGYSMVASFMLSLVVFIRHGFNVVHAHNPPDLFVVVAAFYKLFGVRFVFDHHDLSPEMYCARFGARSNRIVYHVLVWFEKLTCRLADHVIATNQSYAAIEIERGRVSPERITIVRNGPDLNRIHAVEPDPGLRSRGQTVIGYVGEMGLQDGIDNLLRALRHLAYDLGRTDFFAVLVGDGAAWNRANELVTELGLDDHVWLPGRLFGNDLLRVLCAADICVDACPSNPYSDRSSMIKMSEYMALAKPIVAFDLPEHRFTAQEAALYARPNDEAAFARGLAELMDDPARRQVMGAFGRRRVESALAWPYSVTCLLNAYGTLLSRDQAPAHSAVPRGEHAPVGSRFSRWASWLRKRSIGYIVRRSMALARSYGVTAPKAKRRVLDCVRQLASHGCRPTFPIPGGIVRKYSEFSRRLQAMGAELAIHGYHHVDFRSLSPSEARDQLVTAAAVFKERGIDADGYRCPYLSSTEELPRVLPDGLVHYSSNEAVWWDVLPDDNSGNAIFDTLRQFYRAESSRAVVAIPRISNGLVEIPVSLPDDLQLSDGLNLDPAGIRQVWTEMLYQVHRRGELFVVLFHPESFDRCGEAFEGVLREAARMQPRVWITQLRDVSRWWREKTASGVELSRGPAGRLRIRFRCPDRASVLVRNLDTADTEPWSGADRVLKGRTLDVASDVRPFVGVAAGVAAHIVSFLNEQGYIVERGDAARDCALYLDAERSHFRTEVQLLEYLESSPAPLVRFSRWPDEFRSGLCVTGDIDALSLVDYAARLFTARPRAA